MLRNGFYKVNFLASAPGKGGVAKVNGSTLEGGDDHYQYSGVLYLSKKLLSAELIVTAYAPIATAALNGLEEPFSLYLTGIIKNEGFTLTGPSPFEDQPIFELHGTFLISEA